MKQYYEMIPLGGIRRSAPQMAWQLDGGFFGISCPIECFSAQLSQYLTHYGCESAVGRMLQVSVELLILEVGIGGKPFQEDFCKFGTWATDS